MIDRMVLDKELVFLIHNAYAYITRKKVRTSILFLILMVILLSLYGCLSILSSNLRMEKSLNEVSLSSIVVQKRMVLNLKTSILIILYMNMILFLS